MPEFMFDPSTGESVEITRGLGVSAPIANEPSLQELSDQRQESLFKQTARELTQRQNNNADLGESDPAGEIELLEIQNKIATGQFSSPIEEQMLIQQAEALAARLVGGVSDEAPTRTPSNTQQPDGLTDGQKYAEERAAVDDELNEALVTASTILEAEQIERVNDLLGDSDPEVVALAADTITQVTPSMVAASDAVGSAELAPVTHSFISQLAGDEVADDVATLTAAVATGQVSKAQALKTAMHSRPLMEAMLAAAADPSVPFTLAL